MGGYDSEDDSIVSNLTDSTGFQTDADIGIEDNLFSDSEMIINSNDMKNKSNKRTKSMFKSKPSNTITYHLSKEEALLSPMVSPDYKKPKKLSLFDDIQIIEEHMDYMFDITI